MAIQAQAASPPRIEGRHLALEPVHPGRLDPATRALFLACSERVASGADPAAALAASHSALAAGACTAWTVIPRGAGPAGLAWLSAAPAAGAAAAVPAASAGLAWRAPGLFRSPAVSEALLLLLGHAFEACGFRAVAVRPLLRSGCSQRPAPVLAGEWPALRASLAARAAR